MIKLESAQKNAPNFFIIGAAKAGTTTLYDMLDQHPQVYMPFDKEPAFFCDDNYYKNGVDWYVNTFFAQAEDKPARGEATPRYLFWGSKVVPRFQSLYGDAFPKIIVIFRDPVALTYSYYWNSVREGRENLSFEEALAAEKERLKTHEETLRFHGRIVYAYSHIGNYHSQLMPFLERLPEENFLFLLTEDLKDFSRLMIRMENFLGVQHCADIKPVRSNSSSLPRSRRLHQWLRQTSTFKDFLKPLLPFSVRHKMKMAAINMNLEDFRYPPMNTETARRLRQHYAHEARQLENLIQRDLSGWYLESAL